MHAYFSSSFFLAASILAPFSLASLASAFFSSSSDSLSSYSSFLDFGLFYF